jgi:hypothetical protein
VRTALAVARFGAATSFPAVVGADGCCFSTLDFAAPVLPIRDFFRIATMFSPPEIFIA